jgi:type II secretory ATPase GspE/PulE/Tfp pilus assembly ATPase PilB-like protein
MSDAPRAQLVDTGKLSPENAVFLLVEKAVAMGASDLFMVSNEQHIAALVRHLGIVQPIAIMQMEQGKRALSYIKANSGMDLTEKRRPSDGRWIYRKPDGEIVDMRINVLPTMYGEDFAIRLLTRGAKIYAMENLGMTREQFQQYSAMVSSPSGLILITGPTGSGKTATLYATLIRLNDGKRKINTIEDPIEYAIDGLRQSQVNPAIELTFGELLRGVLRQSPDVIMLGEIRDTETAQTAVHAANSGILVFATLHAQSAAGAIQSMRSLGVHNHFLAMSLRGVVSQRLVRTLDPDHRTSIDISDAPDTFEEIKHLLAPGEGKALYAPKPHESNQMTGYAGRTGVFEILVCTKEVRNLISEGKPAREIRDKAIEQKMLQFRQSAMLKVARGETTTEEVFRVIPSEQLLLDEA